MHGPINIKVQKYFPNDYLGDEKADERKTPHFPGHKMEESESSIYRRTVNCVCCVPNVIQCILRTGSKESSQCF